MFGQLAADFLPALAIVGCFVKKLRRRIKSIRVERRKHDWKCPLPAIGKRVCGLTGKESRIDFDIALHSGSAVVSGKQRALTARIKNVWIFRTWRDVSAFAATNHVTRGQ